MLMATHCWSDKNVEIVDINFKKYKDERYCKSIDQDI